jgi:hypothetical protein
MVLRFPPAYQINQEVAVTKKARIALNNFLGIGIVRAQA